VIGVILAPESVAGFAALLADRSRAAMCLALLDGRAWTAAELASCAGIARPTATGHLNQLVSGGLLTEVRQGRHRYLRLAGPQVAQLIEDLALAGGQPGPTRSLRAVRAAHDLAAARTCYDHLAGALGVQLFDGMVRAELICLDGGIAITAAGRAWFAGLAGPDALTPAGYRPLVRGCLDWTERRPHLGGTLGAVLQRQLDTRGWVIRRPGNRAVRVTDDGWRALTGLLPLDAGTGSPAAAPTRG
jgi:DNA-binding transcriptional ArsR family regulator